MKGFLPMATQLASSKLELVLPLGHVPTCHQVSSRSRCRHIIVHLLAVHMFLRADQPVPCMLKDILRTCMHICANRTASWHPSVLQDVALCFSGHARDPVRCVRALAIGDEHILRCTSSSGVHVKQSCQQLH